MSPEPGELYKADCLYVFRDRKGRTISIEPDDIVMVTKVHKWVRKEFGVTDIYFLHTPWNSTETKETSLPVGTLNCYFSKAQRFKS